MGRLQRTLTTARGVLAALVAVSGACSDSTSAGMSSAQPAGAQVTEAALRAVEVEPRARVLVTTRDTASAHAMGQPLRAYRAFHSAPAFAAYVSRDELGALRRDPAVKSIALDEGGSAHLAESLPLAGFAPLEAAGHDGTGITVAVIDSGVDRSHPDLVDAVIDEACFCSSGCCPGGATESFGAGSATDDSGHGTHVAGIIASRGTSSGRPGGAPAAKIVAIKVLDAFNAFCCTSDLVAALDWLATEYPAIDVVNMSFGANGVYAGDCDGELNVAPVAAAARALIDNGALLVASSGNNGLNAMPSPACLADVISVGAVWDEDLGPHAILCSEPITNRDRIACFSNTSSTLDMLAPGAIVTSSWPGGETRGRAGTSQAAPMVSACAAALREAAPDATTPDLLAALTASPAMLTDARNGYAYPRLDCGAALADLLMTDAGTAPDDAGTLDGGPDDGGAAPNDGSAGEGDTGTVDGSVMDGAVEPDGGGSAQDAGSALDASDPTVGDSGIDPGPRHDAAPRPEDGAVSSGPDGAAMEELPDAGSPPHIDAPTAGSDARNGAADGCTCRSAAPSGARAHSLASALFLLALACVAGRSRRRSAR